MSVSCATEDTSATNCWRRSSSHCRAQVANHCRVNPILKICIQHFQWYPAPECTWHQQLFHVDKYRAFSVEGREWKAALAPWYFWRLTLQGTPSWILCLHHKNIEDSPHSRNVNVQASHYCIMCTPKSMPLPNGTPSHTVTICTGFVWFTRCHSHSRVTASRCVLNLNIAHAHLNFPTRKRAWTWKCTVHTYSTPVHCTWDQLVERS